MSGKKLYFNKNLQILFSITLIAVMGVTTVSPSFPEMSRELNLKPKDAGLMIAFFTMPGIILAPLLGMMSDRIGRKKILVPSLFIFTVFGSACAFIHDFNLLLASRFVQGIGAAALGSVNVTVIGDLFHGKDRISAMGYNSTVLSFGTLTYPAIGGSIALLGWNYPHLLSLLAFPVGLAVLFGLKNPEPVKNGKIGAYIKEAFRLVNDREILGLYYGSMASFIIIYGVLISFFPFYLAHKFSVSPFEIGLIISCSSIASSGASFNLGYFSEKFSPKKLLLAAYFLYAAAMVAAMHIHSLLLIIVPVLLIGAANGMNMPVAQAKISNRAPMEYRGAFMSLNGMILRLGQTIGPLVAGYVAEAFGNSGVFYGTAAFSLFTMGVIFLTVKGE